MLGNFSPKSATITFRIEPELKEAAEKAARQDRRSLSNLIEFLLAKHCEARDLLPIDDEEDKKA